MPAKPLDSAFARRFLPESFPSELLANLTQRELKGKFKRSALGYLWSVINPVVNLAIYAIIFGIVFRATPPVGDPSGLDNYALFLAVGLLPWTFLGNSLSGAAASLVANEGLVKKVYFPRSVIPASVILSHLVGFFTEYGVLLVFLLFFGNMVLPWLPLVLVLVAIQFVFLLGLGLFLSVANAYLRDVAHFLGIFINVWFYATPILYPADLVPERATVLGFELPMRDIMALNPMSHFVDAYRDVLYHLRFPTANQWIVLVALAVSAMALGIATFRRLEPDLAEEL